MTIRSLLLLIPIFVLSLQISYAQTENVFRVNFLNPAISFEKATGKNTTFDTSIGFGYNGSYPDLTEYSVGGVQHLFAMFVDLQGRYYYNLNKRASKFKRTNSNNGNFVAARMLYTGPSISQISNLERYNANSFAVGPTWGLQRTYGERFNLLFSAGPIYYFDPIGNGNFFPLMLELNLGFNLK